MMRSVASLVALAMLAPGCALFGPRVQCPPPKDLSEVDCHRAVEVARAAMPVPDRGTDHIRVSLGVCPDWSRKACPPRPLDGYLSVGFFLDTQEWVAWYGVAVSRQDWKVIH